MINNEFNNKDEIDLKEVLSVIYNNRYMISIIVFCSLILAVIFAYFSPNIYKSSTSLEIVSNKAAKTGNTDMLTMAFGISNNNIDNELEILKSRFIAQKALNTVSIGTRYFTINNYKELELYKNSPFVVEVDYLDDKMLGKKIKIIPLNDTTFRLEILPKTSEKLKLQLSLLSSDNITPTYSQTHEYGRSVTTPWGKFTVKRSFKLKNKVYAFSYMPNKNMYPFIANKLSVSPSSKLGSIVTISFEDNVAERAKDVLTAITEAYLEQEIDSNKEEADKTLSFIDFQLESMNKELQASASSLNKYKSENQLINLESKAELAATELSTLESEFYAQNIELELLENLYTHISNNKDISSLSLQSFEQNNDINNLFTELQIRETKKKSLLIEFTEFHPDVLKLTEEINNLKNVIKNTVSNKLLTVKNRKRQLLYVINKHKQTLRALPEQEKQLASLTRNYMVDEKIYSYLLEKRAETAILKASTVSKTRVVDGALVNHEPIKPKRAFIVLVGIILGFILGAIIAFSRNAFNTKLFRLEDLEKLTNVPIYGSIPLVNKKDKQPFYEALRVLRTNLQFTQSKRANKAKIISITSSISGEGKTLLSVELSKILAQGEKKVLLIDLDMRKSRLQKHFKVSNQHGVSTYLAEKSYKEEIVQQTELVNLNIITGGPIPPNPSELLILSTFSKFIEELSEEYSYIILDTPPIGLVTDAMTPLMLSDVALFVVKADYTPKNLIVSINKMIEDKSFNQPGFIFNGAKSDKNYGHGYGYGYGE